MKIITISNFYSEIIFVLSWLRFLSICFSRFIVAVPLKTIFVKKIESLGKKINKLINKINLRSFNNHYKYCSCGFFLFFIYQFIKLVFLYIT